MSKIDYAGIFKYYEFGGRHALESIPSGEVTTRHLSPEEEQHRVDWLDGEPRLAMRFIASKKKCLIKLNSILYESIPLIRKLPITANEAKAEKVNVMLGELCRSVYGKHVLVHVLTDTAYYCTMRSLRIHQHDGIRQITPENVDEVITALGYRGTGDADYLLNNGATFTCYDGSRPIGYCGVHHSFMQNRIGNVGGVYVEEEYRRDGIAKALVSLVAEKLLAQNRVPVYACFDENKASQHTAESAGFIYGSYRVRVFAAEGASETPAGVIKYGMKE